MSPCDPKRTLKRPSEWRQAWTLTTRNPILVAELRHGHPPRGFGRPTRGPPRVVRQQTLEYKAPAVTLGLGRIAGLPDESANCRLLTAWQVIANIVTET